MTTNQQQRDPLAYVAPETKLQLLPQYADVTAELCWNEPENARKRYTVEGFESYFQGRHYQVAGESYISVTKVLDMTIPKPALVPWAAKTALEKVRETLMDPAFPRDAFENTRWELTVDRMLDAARNRPDEVRDEAADWGTGAHKMIQNYIDMGLQGNIVHEVAQPYRSTFDAFTRFEFLNDITWLATELVLWNDDLKVAGTVDAVGRTEEGLVVFDWKTGKATYPEAALQVSAYATMIENLYGEPVARAYVVRFPREQPVTAPEPGQAGPLFEVKEIADLVGSWERYKELVAQAQWGKGQVWRE